jgi:hypothetical protein
VQPLVLVIKGILFLVLQENPHMQAFKKELESVVLSQATFSVEELEALLDRYTNHLLSCPKDIKILLDILSIPQLRPHFREILAGANVCFTSTLPILTETDLVTRWPMFKGMYQRPSSHPTKSGFSYGLDCGNVIDHIHVWVDLDHNLRFQLENTKLEFSLSIMNILKGVIHLSNYFAYKSSERQQGSFGESIHIDTMPITHNYDSLCFHFIACERERLYNLFETMRYKEAG